MRKSTGGSRLTLIAALIVLLLLLLLIARCRACKPPGGGGDEQTGKVVFATSETFDGDLGNFSGADAKCQSAASSAGLSGTFKAWISGRIDSVANGGGTQHVSNRMTHSAGSYVLATGIKVADDWGDLTDGSLEPADALAFAAKILKEQLSIFINFEEDVERAVAEDRAAVKLNDVLLRPVDELELSVRSANCLQNADIKYIGELVQRSEGEMLRTKNFGRKSLNELKKILDELGLEFGMSIESFPNRKDLDQMRSLDS